MIMVIMLHYSLNYEINTLYLLWFLEMGCPIFFVASGFGIMCLINSKYEGKIERSNIVSFYLSRFKALAPAWYTTIILVYIANTVSLKLTGSTLPFGTNRDGLSILCNALFIHGLLPFCNNDVVLGGWYIGTTAVLYVLTPAIHRIICKVRNRRVFAAISSFLVIGIWCIWYYLFRDAFTDSGFGYYIFLIHYPEYLLGILLYYDFKESPDTVQIRWYPALSIIFLIIAIALYINLPLFWHSIPVAWMTGLSTYFGLYYMLITEKDKKPGHLSSLMEGFGRNSYCIFLLHGFFVFPFTNWALSVLNKISTPVIISFFILIPLILSLSYYAGCLFNKLIRKCRLLFTSRQKA